MGHSHMSGYTPTAFRLSNGEFNLTQIASVTHPGNPVGTVGVMSFHHVKPKPRGPRHMLMDGNLPPPHLEWFWGF